MSESNAFDAPRDEPPLPPHLVVLRPMAVQAVFQGGLVAVLDGAWWLSGSQAVGVTSLLWRVALLVGGLTACTLSAGYFLVQGSRSRAAPGLLAAGLVSILVSTVSMGLWALSNP